MLPADHGPPAGAHDDLGQPIVESVWIDPYPDEQLALDDAPAGPDAVYERRESVELAFIAALQHLPARQRAVLILRDVLGFSAREVAEALDATPVSVDSALQRAHRTVDAKLPERSQQTTLRTLGDEALRKIVDRFVAAWERTDVDAVVAMLADDAAITMPPYPTWFQGREAVAAFLARVPLAARRRWRLAPTRANGQPAFGAYNWDAEQERFVPHHIIVLTLDGDRIAEITAFLFDQPFERFGLPAASILSTRTSPAPPRAGLARSVQPVASAGTAMSAGAVLRRRPGSARPATAPSSARPAATPIAGLKPSTNVAADA